MTQEGGEAIHLALFVAYFVEGVNLAVVDSLVDIAADAGLDADAARRALAKELKVRCGSGGTAKAAITVNLTALENGNTEMTTDLSLNLQAAKIQKLCEQHNIVNKKLGKPVFSCDMQTLDDRWRKSKRSECQR